MTLGNEHLELEFSAGAGGLVLRRIRNRVTGAEHLVQPSALFEIGVEGFPTVCRSDRGITIDSVHREPDGRHFEASGTATGLPAAFTLRVECEPNAGTAFLKLRLRNRADHAIIARVVSPRIAGLSTRGMMAALPQEAAGVVSLDGGDASLGMPMDGVVGLPHGFNTMEVVSLYDPSGRGGVFFADAEADLDAGSAPLQFTLTGDTVCAYWVGTLEVGEERDLPVCVVGVHDSGDWHATVDDYVRRHRKHWRFPKTPAWFRDQGAIYSVSGAGGGGIYMEYAAQDLKTRISSFEDLPLLLDEAQKLGTNIVYLWDYWEGTSEGGRPPYWNKGDYTPRQDLGGASAFREGIRRLHARGGRIILYVEPFIVFWYSHLGKEKGPAWGGRDSAGKLYETYPQNYSMVPCSRPWQERVAGIGERLIQDYGADGIFLDSWGWQMNWRMKTEEEGVLYTPLEYSLGVLALARRVRERVRAVKPDAVVMGESMSGALGRCIDGGLSADFAWLRGQNGGRFAGSPARYAMPELNVFTNGRNRNEMNQVFAAGYNLALLNASLPDADYIRRLVRIRQQYKDALIHGWQIAQPPTGDASVYAYRYRGAKSEVMTVVNASDRNYSGKIALPPSETSSWRDLLSGSTYKAQDGALPLSLAAGTLAVLARQDH